MKKMILAVLLVAGVILLPAFAEAQLGACYFLDVDLTDPIFDVEAVCVDGVTLEFCLDVIEGEWEEDLICDSSDQKGIVQLEMEKWSRRSCKRRAPALSQV